MLHSKFRGNRPVGSGEDFDRFLPYRGVAAILVMFYHIWARWPSCLVVWLCFSLLCYCRYFDETFTAMLLVFHCCGYTWAIVR